MNRFDRLKRAERVRKNGAATLTSIGAIAELAQDNRTLVAAFRDVKEAASAAGDIATKGAMEGWTDQAEQRIWLFGLADFITLHGRFTGRDKLLLAKR